MKKTISENYKALAESGINLDLFYSVNVTPYDVSLQGHLTDESHKYVSGKTCRMYIDNLGYYNSDTELGNDTKVRFVLTHD